MLLSAMLYKDEIQKKFLEHINSEDMLYYTGSLRNHIPSMGDDDGGSYQYAIVDNNNLIGYFEYSVDWYSSCAHRFGLFSFDRNNKTIGIDVYKEIRKIINDYHIHRIEWRMIGGNPVEKHYDTFCKRYHGKKFVLTDVIKDRSGKYHDDIIYEIILKNGDV